MRTGFERIAVDRRHACLLWTRRKHTGNSFLAGPDPGWPRRSSATIAKALRLTRCVANDRNLWKISLNVQYGTSPSEIDVLFYACCVCFEFLPRASLSSTAKGHGLSSPAARTEAVTLFAAAFGQLAARAPARRQIRSCIVGAGLASLYCSIIRIN